MTMASFIKSLSLPLKTSAAFSVLLPEDIPSLTTLLNNYLQRYCTSPSFQWGLNVSRQSEL